MYLIFSSFRMLNIFRNFVFCYSLNLYSINSFKLVLCILWSIPEFQIIRFTYIHIKTLNIQKDYTNSIKTHNFQLYVRTEFHLTTFLLPHSHFFVYCKPIAQLFSPRFVIVCIPKIVSNSYFLVITKNPVSKIENF